MLYSSPEAFLGHGLDTVRPYLDRLVLIGGFAVRLYEHHPRAMPATTRVLRAFDADLATPALFHCGDVPWGIWRRPRASSWNSEGIASPR
jgi:hypothetical protein